MGLFSDLRYKEVIDLKTGRRLGFISDAEIDETEGKILSLIVPGDGKLGGLLGREPDYVLPWQNISRLGNDIVLVELNAEIMRKRREKRQFFY